VREWFSDRPAFVALAALLAPLLITVTGLGLAQLVPDVRQASHALPRLAVLQPVPAPAPLPTARGEQVVPAGRAQVLVPILEYHYIRVNPDPGDRLGFTLSVTPADFAAQLDWLRASGYHTVDLNDVRAYFQGHVPLPSRPVVLTFDDGYKDFYTAAFPALVDHGFKAVSYVVPGFLDGPRYLSTAEVRSIDAAGMEVAAHTMHHVDLTKASAAQLVVEVDGSRSALEQIVGHPVRDFCYPSGKYDATVIAAVQHAGFESATTEVPGTGHNWAGRLTWTRVRVNGGERLDQFIASLGQPEPTVTPSPNV
jgi:peptidoglycan/xylan/chitin deacetylase (PgdA/CDA1 family)